MLSLQLDQKVSFNLQYGKFYLIVRVSLALISSEVLPKYNKTQIKLPLDKELFKKKFYRTIHEITGITIVFKYRLQSFPMNIPTIGT